MSLKDEFEAATIRVKSLASTPSVADLLALYALYKQATVGDATGARPGMLDMKGRAKFDAWNERRGMTTEQAMQAYLELAAKLGQSTTK